MTITTDGLPAGTRVSCPTAPWRHRAWIPSDRGGRPATVLHVVSFIYPDITIPVALCFPDVVLEHDSPAKDPMARLCRPCVRRLTTHGLWPL